MLIISCALATIVPLDAMLPQEPCRPNGCALMAVYEAAGAAVDVLVVSLCDGRGISQKHALGLMTCHLRAALLPKQDIYIFAPGNLGVRRDEMVAQLALAHDCAWPRRRPVVGQRCAEVPC